MNNELITVGWREWVYLPDLHINKIKAKIDTGARTSCLHAFDIKPYNEEGIEKVRFLIHPIQKNTDIVSECDAVVIDKRMVSDSGGHKEERYVISTQLVMGDQQWEIEMTLTSRDNMMFRMLLGRTAMSQRIIVNPASSYLMGKPE
ncbi:MAG: ATP-dependent zinc protease [Gammaproteobacteria bacterium]|nr:ATP-dependent zinc protease [Gammaproteobacteria bacterium]MCW8909622.1 ATP-dependent zinc protease [Gammaproteobacteria bacterium]MCW9005847.1 ATP-dependent zinc protease [Gammaproteobacteria bacterium]MCW9056861.1 ATP-dependent zinc protease [Gammaproteobacteria bacterium]